MSLLVTNVQRFCIHDGPGIRTTIFLKGCSLNCPWCANPETKSKCIEYYLDDKKCVAKESYCDINPSCSVLKKCPLGEEDYIKCVSKSIVRFGEIYDEDRLLDIISRDECYYVGGGGVTFSGGEPLLQLVHVNSFLKKLSDLYSICIETSLCAPLESLSSVYKNIDLFYIDVKTLVREDLHSIGGNLDVFLNNLYFLKNNGYADKMIFRIPYVPNISDKHDNILLLNSLIKDIGPRSVQVFKLHNLAKTKYNLMGKEYSIPQINDVSFFSFINSIKCSDVQILEF